MNKVQPPKKDMSHIAPWSGTQNQRKQFKKRLLLIGAGAVFLGLLIMTIIIAVNNTKDPADRIKNEIPTADPYYFDDSTPSPEPSETPEPGYQEVALEGWITTEDFGSSVKMRTQPTTNSLEVAVVRDREPVEIIGITAVQQDGYEWYQIKYEDSKGYVRGDFISLESPPRLPDILYGLETEDVVTGKSMYSRLDYVSHAAPGVVVDLTLADSDNFMGHRLYEKDVALIQYSTGEKLDKAAKMFAEDGFQLVLWDAYRPYSVSVKMFDLVEDVYLAANPALGSKHNRGAAVDVTLYKGDKMLNMPTDDRVMDLDESSRNSSMSTEQRALMDYLTEVMVECGFVAYKSEWWHFNDSDWEDYPVMDFPLSDF